MSESVRLQDDKLASQLKKITSRTTGAKGNKFLRVITSFNDRKIESNRYQVTNQN